MNSNRIDDEVKLHTVISGGNNQFWHYTHRYCCLSCNLAVVSKSNNFLLTHRRSKHSMHFLMVLFMRAFNHRGVSILHQIFVVVFRAQVVEDQDCSAERRKWRKR
jgi:hypothetical protein